MPGMRWLVKIFFSVNSITNKMAMTSRFRKYGKKRRGLRRRATRRVNRIYRPVRARNLHYFSRYSYTQAPLSSFTTNANGQKFGVVYAQGLEAIQTTIGGLVSMTYSDFTNLFDVYKLLSFTVEFHPRFTGRDVAYGAGSVPDIPTIYYVYDIDDSNTPGSADEIMQHQRVYTRRLDRPVRITCKSPCVASTIYGSVASNYGPKRAPWIDMASSGTPHYGIKYMIQGVASRDYSSFFDIRVKWNFVCKNPR